MAIESLARSKYVSTLATLGKPLLNVAYPDDFELYVCGLELTDENFKTLQYFVFPVMPISMEENQTFGSNVKKTLGGVTVLNTQTFMPNDVTIAGTFGRKMRVLIGNDLTNIIQYFKSGTKPTFDTKVKTGYGCIKILENIVNLANQVNSNNKTVRLIFHNCALGNSYLIKPMSLKLSQNQQSNMIWNYSLTMKAIADIKDIMSKDDVNKSRRKLVGTNIVQNGVNKVVDKLTTILSKKI